MRGASESRQQPQLHRTGSLAAGDHHRMHLGTARDLSLGTCAVHGTGGYAQADADRSGIFGRVDFQQPATLPAFFWLKSRHLQRWGLLFISMLVTLNLVSA